MESNWYNEMARIKMQYLHSCQHKRVKLSLIKINVVLFTEMI